MKSEFGENIIFVDPETQQVKPEFLPRVADSIYDDHQEAIFTALYNESLKGNLGGGQGEGIIYDAHKERSRLLTSKARFEMLKGHDEEACYYAAKITEFRDKLALFEESMHQDSNVVLVLGDMRAQAEQSKDPTDIVRYLLAEIRVGMNVFSNCDAIQTLLQDKSIVDRESDEESLLREEFQAAILTHAIEALKSGDELSLGILKPYLGWSASDAIKHITYIEAARANSDNATASKKARKELETRGKLAVRSAFAVGHSTNEYVELISSAMEGSESALAYIREHCDKLYEVLGSRIYLAAYLEEIAPDVYKESVMRRINENHVPPAALKDTIKVFLKYGEAYKAEKIYTDAVVTYSKWHEADKYKYYLPAQFSLMEAAMEMALYEGKWVNPEQEFIAGCQAKFELLLDEYDREKRVVMKDIVDISRFRTSFNRRIDALVKEVDDIKYPAEKLKLLSALSMLQKIHDTSSDSSWEDQMEKIEELILICEKDVLSSLTVSAEDIRNMKKALDIRS